MKSINPVNGEVLADYREHSQEECAAIINRVHESWKSWKEQSFSYRAGLFLRIAQVIRSDKDRLSRLMTSEMGKLLRESFAEIEKCAGVCEYYAANAEKMLGDEVIVSDAGRSLVCFQPIGVVLAVMPWNFPFWQVFRFAAPSLMAGNAAVLKHASNVPGCALAIEELFIKAGFPENIFRTLMIPASAVEAVINNPLVKAATLTGSEDAGSKVASAAGRNLKKTVLELGGSDPFIVFEDADLEKAVATAVSSRMINQGQTCISAKRFIVSEKVLDEFTKKLVGTVSELRMGDPLDPSTQVAPMARPDLVDDIESQVKRSVAKGARLLWGGSRPAHQGFYYKPAILTDVTPDMPVYREETFGPVFAIIPFLTEEEAVRIANDTRFGLAGAVWTADPEKGERIAKAVETGAMFVNGMVKSDSRLPFGGIKKSGYGRELASYGIKEFVNIKTIWIA
ncbi:MAG: NAD-dependent succinate-semialdehyde dehydrogenase [Bacteroidetes bacterium]|nr:NAD-dependent succinate-semialdehyde dehydrogenase [Bacteroidota bacterium]